MLTSRTKIDTPRVWVGCVTCVRNGDLNGRWIDAIDAETVFPQDLHNGPTTHDELWCYHSKNMLRDYEMDLEEAGQQAQCLAAVDPYERDALRAWARSSAELTDSDGLPDLDEFHDRYKGEWSSFTAYADYYLANIGLLDGVDESVTRYFDLAAYARDLKQGYKTLPTDDDTVFVFADS